MLRLIRRAVVVPALCLCAAAARAEIKLENTTEHITGSRLEGRWEPDPELTKRLGGKDVGSLEFRADPEAVKKIPEAHHEYLVDFKVYQAGYVKVAGKEHPYLLVELAGNLGLLYFLGTGGDILGDFKDFTLSLATAKNPTDDLLFIGAEGLDLSMAGYRRVGGKSDRVSEGLKKSAKLTAERITLMDALTEVAAQIGVRISLVVNDLQEQGITRNQAFAVDAADMPAEKLLATVLKKADPDGRLAFVVRYEPDGEGEIVIVTRHGAERRNESLPEIFANK